MIQPRETMRIGLLAATVAVGTMVSHAAVAQSGTTFTPVTDAMLQDPAPGDWLTWRRTLDSWGYSPLDEIDTANVDHLRMVRTPV